MEGQAKKHLTLRFGAFDADFAAGELRRQGVRVKIQEQPFQVLEMLLERPGEVVTREELRQKLWPDGTFVDFDHGVNTAINKIREALGDTADNPRFVETLPRRGYRFIYPVEALTPGPSPQGRGEKGYEMRPPPSASDAAPYDAQPSPLGRGWSAAGGPGEGAVAAASSPPTSSVAAIYDRRPETAVADRRYSKHRVALAAVAIVAVSAVILALNVIGLRDRLFPPPAPKIQSIAVLPLENLSGDPEQEYFADGMTEALISDLGKISTLRVISRTSVMRYKQTKKSIPDIARELNVDAVVEGSVLRAGDRVRITAQLIDARRDRHLWSRRFDRDPRDVLALQSEVAQSIAREIQIKLTPQEQTRLAKARPVNPEAHQAF